MIYYYSKDTYRHVRIPIYRVLVFVLIIFGLGFFLGRKSKSCDSKPVVVNIVKPLEVCPPVFHKDSLKAFIKKLNIKHPDVVYAQTLQETDRHRSGLFKSNNNLFGMKKAGKRPQLLSGMKRGHAYYEDMYLAGWQLSVIDYAMYQAAFARGLTKEQYLKRLSKSGYAEDDSYVQKIKKLLDEW
jgi:hypothetical protein